MSSSGLLLSVTALHVQPDHKACSGQSGLRNLSVSCLSTVSGPVDAV